MYGNYINKHNEYVEVLFDSWCENPRKDDGGLYTHFYTYNRYDSPDVENLWTVDGMKDRTPTLWEVLEEFIDTAWWARDDDPEWMEELECTSGDGREYLFEVIDYINEHGGVALPVSMYDHSSVGYGVGHPSQFVGAYPWDAGYVGLIYARDEDIKKNFLVDEVTDELRKRVEKCMEEEVEYYSQWANGECYYFNLYDKSGNLIDSCSGFIGDDTAKSGIEDYTGELEETDMSLDEWVESVA
jgi:hypothetical protein